MRIGLTSAVVAAVVAGSCSRSVARPPEIEHLRARVVNVFPHDRGAFTQGLEFFEGALYESTGLVGRSSLRLVNPATGAVEKSVPIDGLFAEGLARVGDRLYQLSWREGRAQVWSLRGFEKQRAFHYDGEGWGLCYDGKRLVMSDGSATLAFRNVDAFTKESSVVVTRAGTPVENLNELECAGGLVYANIWQTDEIVRIDPTSGRVTASIDASGLLAPADRAGVDVLNGIAFVPSTGHFLITGKLWPKLFEVEFVPVAR